MSRGQDPVIVVGAGPAGLATSYELRARGIDHVVLERGRVGQSWRDRWDSFCLVTPNWYLQLPGGAYTGEDPDGFMSRDEVVAYLERYAHGFGAPILDRIDVTALRGSAGGFVVDTSEGQMRTNAVVLATGAFQRPHRPPAADLPADVLVIDAGELHEPGCAPRRRRPRRRERTDRMPDRRRGAQSRSPRDPRVRQGRVGAAPCRWTRHRLVARRDAVSSTRRSTIFRPRRPALLPTSRPPAATAVGTSTTERFSPTASP